MASMLEAGAYLIARGVQSISQHGYRHTYRRAAAYIRRKLSGENALGALDYARWLEAFDYSRPEDLGAATEHMWSLRNRPVFSIVTPCYNSDPVFLSAALASVKRQVYRNWRHYLVDDASSHQDHFALLQGLATDSRFVVSYAQENQGIAEASNAAARLGQEDWIVFLDHDDTLHPLALYHLAAAINEDPALLFLYSDEDKLDAKGKRIAPYFKGEFDPELLYGHNLVTHIMAIKRELFTALGGFRSGFDGAQDYDLVCRVATSAPAESIKHIPFVLYHWRQHAGSTALATRAKPEASAAARRALTEMLERKEQAFLSVERHPLVEGHNQVIYAIPSPAPHVAIIIPTRDRLDLLERAVATTLERTAYSNFSIHIVDNQSREPETLAYLARVRERLNVSVISADYAFNFSRLSNNGVMATMAPFVLLMNNDIEVVEPNWLNWMVAQAARAEVGAVGPMLLYGDEATIQHAGVGIGFGGAAAHLYCGLPRYTPANMAKAMLTQRVAAVTGACLLTRRDVFDRVGGMDEQTFPVAYNDVDYCLKVRKAGFQVIYEPRACLIHKESQSRGLEDTPQKRARQQSEIAALQARWGEEGLIDPFVNPCYSRDSAHFHLSRIERRRLPWRSSLSDAGCSNKG